MQLKYGHYAHNIANNLQKYIIMIIALQNEVYISLDTTQISSKSKQNNSRFLVNFPKIFKDNQLIIISETKFTMYCCFNVEISWQQYSIFLKRLHVWLYRYALFWVHTCHEPMRNHNTDQATR